MVGLREGKQSGQQDLQVAETLQQMKILKGEKRQATAPRKVHKFDKAKELMFVWSNYILYWHKGLTKNAEQKKVQNYFCVTFLCTTQT